MNIFVDSNIYLDFYHFADDDLDELKKLIDLIKKGEVTLNVTTQVIDEVKRNRDNKVNDAYKKFDGSGKSIDLPQMCKSYPEYHKIKELQKEIEKVKCELSTKLSADIHSNTLKSDDIIKQLLDISVQLDSAAYIKKARDRYDLGSPPGKNGSLGDAISWITLLEELDDENDLFFISDDKDFKSSLDDTKLDNYLKDEWENRKNSKIFFYTKLSAFFQEHHKDIQLKVEEEKNGLIEELSASHNFATTHLIISKLAMFISFTDEQVRDLVNIAMENSQVNWILSDPDVNEFYKKLIEGKGHVIPTEQYESLTAELAPENSEIEKIDLDALLAE